MKIAKAQHLKRLLKLQDILLSTLVFTLIVNGAWLLGLISLDVAQLHLLLCPLVLVFSIAASVLSATALNVPSSQTVVFASKYALLVCVALMALGMIGLFSFIDWRLLGGFAAALAITLFANRRFLRWWYFKRSRERPEEYLQVLVIGSGARMQRLVSRYKRHSEWGIDVVGVLDPCRTEGDAHIEGVPFLGDVTRIGEVLAEQPIDEVIVCLPRSLIDRIGCVISACEEQAVCIKFMADLYDIEADMIGFELVGGQPMLTFEPVAFDERQLMAKRIFDLALVIPALIVLAPVFALIALVIKLDSPGPVFFLQVRVGLNKHRFRMVKFRSMYQDAEEQLAALEHLNEASGPIFKMKNDPRVTRVGRFLRRFSLDELPQLFNVLAGEMSLIGPRPMSVRDVQQFRAGIQRRRFSVRPGLACLREISGRSQLSFDKWLELDLRYIDQWSFWLDLKILFRLIPVVVSGRGAS